MASLLTVRLLKGDSPSWGFRLQGGKDFGTPLVIQKVIVGSPAERAGLVAGDSVIRVNQTDVFNLRHKDAQDVLLRAGNSFDMTIQRGGSTWKPSVIPTGHISTPSPTINNISPVTRTSLAAKPTEDIGAIGTGHNVSAKPFLNGTLNGGPKLVNTQYNSPLKLYSEESIAETLSAQTEVLSTGALGVNFKKNEKNYDASKSAVLSLLKEEESSPRTPDHTEHHLHNSGIDSAPSPVVAAGLRHVAAPENKPQPPSPQLPPGQNICADCERLIVGVFVRIKDKNLHVECFKCSTCGSSLKNVGYYNINNKLYCDIHAKLAARNNPPAPNLVPVTVPPGGRAPVNAISAALASHPYPTAAPLSPKTNSYQHSVTETDAITPTNQTISITKELPAPIIFNKINNITPKPFGEYLNRPSLTGPRPFGSVPGPLSPSSNLLTKTAAPLSPVAPVSAPTYSPISSTEHELSDFPPTNENYPRKSEIFIEVKNNNLLQPYDQITITIPKTNLIPNVSSEHSSENSSSSVNSTISGDHSPKYAQDRSSRSISQTPWISNFIHENPDDDFLPNIETIEINDFSRNSIRDVNEKNTNDDKVSVFKEFDIYEGNNIDLKPKKILSAKNDSSSEGKLTTGVLETDFPLIEPLESTKLVKKTVSFPDNLLLPSNVNQHEPERDVKTNRENGNSVQTRVEINGTDSDNRNPICHKCEKEIVRGPFITALGKIWCPNHFICATPSCRRPLQDMGFVEEQGQLYCEYCFEQYLAPICAKCGSKIKGDCLKAIGKGFHPECFNCSHCGKLFGNSPFFLEDGSPYCEADWNELFTTKCFACGFPVEAGDRWVEALNNNYHSQCFNCTMCKKNLEGQSFFAKGGRPYCRNHAR